MVSVSPPSLVKSSRHRPTTRNTSADVTIVNPAGFQSSAANLPIGGASGAVAVADFNQDGFQDLVATLSSSAIANNLAVYLGSGNGSFGSPSFFTTDGLQPLAVVTGDFNGDRLADIVTANFGSDTISLRLGNGAGGFNSATTFAVGDQPNSLAAADFNEDGRLDVVTANSGTDANSISVLLANANGGLNSARTYATAGSVPFAVTTGDLNKDGDVDIITADSVSRSISVFLGKGNGDFINAKQFFIGASNPVAITTGDFDGDRNLDIATGNLAGNGRQDVTVLFGDGKGEFTDILAYAAGGGVNSITAGDFNGDHNLDLAGTLNGSAEFVLLVGDGRGNFTGSRNSAGGSSVIGLATGDFNRDSKLDLVSTNSGTNNISVILNKTTLVLLRSSDDTSEVDGSQEQTTSMTVNLKTERLTINTTPVRTTRTIRNFQNVLGTQANDSITGGDDKNILSGNAGQDTLTGLGGNDTMTGGAGKDRIKGDAGNDRIAGNTESDQLTGGDGKDRFIFDHGKAFAAADGQDKILDFDRGSDRIVLDRGTFTALQGSVSFASVQSVTAAQTNRALITYIRSTGRLYYNQNGNSAGFGSGGLFATLDRSGDFNGKLVVSDFQLQA